MSLLCLACNCRLYCRGLPSQAFEYIHYNGGLESESDYPYHAKDGKCHFSNASVAATVVDVMNFSQVQMDNTEKLGLENFLSFHEFSFKV